MESKDDKLQWSITETPVKKGTIRVSPKTETAQEEQPKVLVKKDSVDLPPEPTAEEAIVEAEMDQTEAEDHPNLQHAEGGFPKKSNA